MAEENTQPVGAANQGNEPTAPISSPDNWTPAPASAWARQPGDNNPGWAQPNAAAQHLGPNPAQPPGVGVPPQSGQPIPGALNSPAAAHAVRPDAYAGAVHPPASATSTAPTQPYPAGYPLNGAAQYAPPGYQGYQSGAPYQSGPYANLGQGGHPGYYPPQQYYQAPVTVPPKQRWPIVVAAVLLSVVLAGAGFVMAGGQLGASSSPEITTAPVTEPTLPAAEPSQGTAQSEAVSSAESKGVVLIEAKTTESTAYGTGMVLTAEGKVLTNYHVIAGSEKLAVTIAETGDTYVATVLGFDQSRDVALLQLTDASGLATVTIDQDQVNVGDEVAAVGNASGGMELVKASGEVTATSQDLTVSSDSPWGNTEDLSGLVATDAGAVAGDSGGPMFDAEAEVLGITTAGSTKEHTSYAVPIATALAVVDQIEAGQDAGTVRVGPAGYLGVQVGSSYTGAKGATVSSVVKGGPAAKAGITAGSRITKVGDVTITSKTNMASVIRAVEPGAEVKITWKTSGGATKSAMVTMGSSPVN